MTPRPGAGQSGTPPTVNPEPDNGTDAGDTIIKTAASSTVPWEWCDCSAGDWYESGNHPEIAGSGNVTCGCGRPDCDHSMWKRHDFVHWEGKHWLLAHAFEEAMRRLTSHPPREPQGAG